MITERSLNLPSGISGSCRFAVDTFDLFLKTAITPLPLCARRAKPSHAMGDGCRPTAEGEEALADFGRRPQPLEPVDSLAVPLLVCRAEIAQISKQEGRRTDFGCEAFLNARELTVDVADEHALCRHGDSSLIKQRPRLQRACGIRLVVIDVAHPVEVACRKQAGVNDMLLAPKLKSQIEKNVGMFRIYFAGDVSDPPHRFG